jgi:hypothetical protein
VRKAMAERGADATGCAEDDVDASLR